MINDKNTDISNNSNNEGVIVGNNTGTVNVGMTPEQACKITLELFYENFPKLQAEAKQIATKRAEEFCSELFEKLKKQSFKGYNSFADPDVQYITYQATQEYVRRGKKELKDILSSIVIKRIQTSDELLKITLNESIRVAGLLTAKQLNILSLKFIVAHTKRSIDVIEKLFNYLKTILIPLVVGIDDVVDFDIRHLNFCGCGQSMLGSKIGVIIARSYEKLFKFPHKIYDSNSVVSVMTEESKIMVFDGAASINIKDYIIQYCPESKKLFEVYNKDIFTFDLTSIGFILGAINAETQVDVTFDLLEWIK